MPRLDLVQWTRPGRFLRMLLLYIAMSNLPFPDRSQAEPVIFEQFGTLVGSTSYLHVHIPLYIDGISKQHDRYEEYLTTKFANAQTVKTWLYEGLLYSKNISVNAKTIEIPDHIRTLATAIDTNSKIFYEIGQLHYRDLQDIKHSVRALKNMMPLRPVNPYAPIRVDREQNGDEDDQELLTENAYVVAEYPGDGNDCEIDGCARVRIPSKFDDPLNYDRDEESFLRKASKSAAANDLKMTIKTRVIYTVNNYTTASPHTPYKTRKLFERWENVDAHPRVKRFIPGLIALPLATAATAMGLFNRAQISALKEELFEVKSNTKRLFVITQNLTKSVIQLDKNMNDIRTALITIVATNPTLADARMTRIENQLRHRVMRTTHAVQSAIHGRLAIDYLDPVDVKTLFENIQVRAGELGCDLLIEYHTDIFQVESSLLFDGKNAHILVHVPMAPKEGQLRLFRLHPFPLPLTEDRFLIPDVKNDILAISSTSNRLNVQLAAVELLSCHRMNQLFMCDNFGVMSRKFNTTCLGALYMSMFDIATEVCKFKVAPAEELAYQIRKGEFVVYVPQASTINIVCRNGTHAEQHLKKGSQTIIISKGCMGELKHHRLLSDYSDNLMTEIKSYNWDWEPVEFMETAVPMLDKALEKLAEFKINTPDLAQIQYLATVPDQQGTPLIGHLITTACVLGLIITLAVFVYCCYNKCTCCHPTETATQRRGQGRRKRSPSPSPSCCARICCKPKPSRSRPPPTPRLAARYTRGSDTDEVTIRHSTVRRSPRTSSSKLEVDLHFDELQYAMDRSEKRLSTLEQQLKKTIV